MSFSDGLSKRDIERNKAIRGHIIRALAMGYNGSLYARQLVSTLTRGNYITTPDIGVYLKYLQDGGYIEFNPQNTSPFNACDDGATVSLTKKGVDLVEYTIQDGGVDV